MAKYIIYRGNKYVRVDSARSMVDISDSLYDAINKVEWFFRNNTAKELNARNLGLHTEADLGSAVNVSRVAGREKAGVYDIRSQRFKETNTETNEIKKQMMANKEKAVELFRRVCQKGGITLKKISIRVSAAPGKTWCYDIRITAPQAIEQVK